MKPLSVTSIQSPKSRTSRASWNCSRRMARLQMSRLASPIARTGEIYATAFPDMHRELFNVYLSGDDLVVVQLALQGTHNGPLQLPMGTISATGKRMDAPCCDVFQLRGEKVQRFDCYPSVALMMTQLGVISNLEVALAR